MLHKGDTIASTAADVYYSASHKKKENKPNAISGQKQRFLLHREHGMTVNSQVGTDALGESSVRPHTATTALTKPPKQTESLKNKSKDRY